MTRKLHTLHSRGFGHHFLLPLLSIVAVGGIGFYMMHLSQAATTPTGTSTFKLFAPAWRGLGGSANAGNIKYFAEIFGTMNPSTIEGKASGTKVYRYTLGPYVTQAYVRCSLIPSDNTTKNPTKCGQKALADEAIAKGVESGLAVYPNIFPDNYLLNPASSATKTYVTANAAQVIKYNATATYDGLYTDSMGVGPLGATYMNEKPADPATGVLYTKTQWLKDEEVLLNAKSEGLAASGKVLIMNGLAKGTTYFSADPNESPSVLLTEKVAGGMAESTFRDPGSKTSDWRSEADWLKDVEMIRDVQSMGKKGYWWTKCWSTNAYVDTVGGKKRYTDSCKYESGDVTKNIQQVRRFAVASFLLGAGDKSYFSFDANKYEGAGKGNAAEFYPEYKAAMKLGTAKDENYSKNGSLYSRKFSNGFTVVNPTEGDTTYNLGKLKAKNFDGRNVTGTVTIPAHSGAIFVVATGGSTGGTGKPQDARKARVLGYVDKDGVPLASYQKYKDKDLVRDFTINVDWSKVQTGPTSFDFSTIDTPLGTAATNGAHVRLRIFAGRLTPGWVKEATGSISWTEPHDSEIPPYKLPLFWTSGFQSKYKAFLSKLSERYDGNASVSEVTVSMCMTTWAEPFVRQSIPVDEKAATAAGYQYRDDYACIKNNVDYFDTRSGTVTGAKLFPNTRVALAVNPFMGYRPPSSVDPDADTLKLVDYCRTVLGPRCVLGNNSVRWPLQGDFYPAIYSKEKSLGSPLYYQTAKGERVGDYKKAIEFAIKQGTYSLEFSQEDYKTYDKATLADLLATFKNP
ncbi:MAG: putative glycoside hydrolase [Candidatus Saccharimonadales bacterium]